MSISLGTKGPRQRVLRSDAAPQRSHRRGEKFPIGIEEPKSGSTQARTYAHRHWCSHVLWPRRLSFGHRSKKSI